MKKRENKMWQRRRAEGGGEGEERKKGVAASKANRKLAITAQRQRLGANIRAANESSKTATIVVSSIFSGAPRRSRYRGGMRTSFAARTAQKRRGTAKKSENQQNEIAAK